MLKEFLNAYLEAALWSSNDDNGEPLDSGRSISDLPKETVQRAEKDCAAFYENWHPLWEYASHPHEWSVDEQAGHDFWLTRNGHGAGFWDRPEMYGEENAKRLTEASKRAGGCDMYVGDDGLIYIS